MPYEFKTQLGVIKIHNKFFSNIIRDVMKSPGLSNKIWPSNKRGKINESIGPFSVFEYSEHMEVYPLTEKNVHKITGDNSIVVKNVKNKVILDIPVVVKFGTSIKHITDKFANRVREEIKEKLNVEPVIIRIKITGIKSKSIASRDMEIVKIYELK